MHAEVKQASTMSHCKWSFSCDNIICCLNYAVNLNSIHFIVLLCFIWKIYPGFSRYIKVIDIKSYYLVFCLKYLRMI